MLSLITIIKFAVYSLWLLDGDRMKPLDAIRHILNTCPGDNVHGEIVENKTVTYYGEVTGIKRGTAWLK